MFFTAVPQLIGSTLLNQTGYLVFSYALISYLPDIATIRCHCDTAGQLSWASGCHHYEVVCTEVPCLPPEVPLLMTKVILWHFFILIKVHLCHFGAYNWIRTSAYLHSPYNTDASALPIELYKHIV